MQYAGSGKQQPAGLCNISSFHIKWPLTSVPLPTALYNVQSVCMQQGVSFQFSVTTNTRKYKILLSIINNGKKSDAWHQNYFDILILHCNCVTKGGALHVLSLQLVCSCNGLVMGLHWNCFPHPHLTLEWHWSRVFTDMPCSHHSSLWN